MAIYSGYFAKWQGERVEQRGVGIPSSPTMSAVQTCIRIVVRLHYDVKQCEWGAKRLLATSGQSNGQNSSRNRVIGENAYKERRTDARCHHE
jgi:hypothetical protein